MSFFVVEVQTTATNSRTLPRQFDSISEAQAARDAIKSASGCCAECQELKGYRLIACSLFGKSLKVLGVSQYKDALEGLEFNLKSSGAIGRFTRTKIEKVFC